MVVGSISSIDKSIDCDASDTRHSIYSRNGSDVDDNAKRTDKLVAKETRIVLMLRIAVIFVLIVCATAVALTIYHITQQSEIGEFKIQYEGASEKVLKAFKDILLVRAGSLSSLSVAITTQGKCQSVKTFEIPIRRIRNFFT
jgi:hypothetical protein